MKKNKYMQLPVSLMMVCALAVSAGGVSGLVADSGLCVAQDDFDTSQGCVPLLGCTYTESNGCSIGCKFVLNWECYTMGTRLCQVRTRTGTCSWYGDCMPVGTPPPYVPPVPTTVRGSRECLG